MTDELALEWSRRFGLAHARLFEDGEAATPDHHAVLLDGGNGSFILSHGEELDDPRQAASWAWSAALPSHVAVVGAAVTVTRWDAPYSRESFTLKSVTDKLDAFYGFLSQQRSSSRRDVVATLLDLFRAVRGEVQAAGAPDETSVNEFLRMIARLMASERQQGNAAYGASFATSWTASGVGLNVTLDEGQLERLEAGFRNQMLSLFELSLSASLAVRHAASAIFQEAHFAFESAAQGDLFSHQPANTTKSLTRGSHHFTPPSLARSLVEQALAALPNAAGRHELAVCDPACGSGAFLTEAARTLRRAGFNGKLRLIGRDLSPSAITMAKFALGAAKHDWQPAGGIELDVDVADTLDASAIPPSDIVVMNPPFLAWPMMDARQREKVNEVLGASAKQRPDLSMAFVSNALNSVKDGGVVASLLPASILAIDSGSTWRKSLLAEARLAFLGSLGDYGLFVHALVQVAAIVMAKGDASDIGIGLISANESKATGDALRSLRRIGPNFVTGVSGKGWRIAKIDRRVLKEQDRWRLLPEAVERSLVRLDELGIASVEKIFDVKQGLLTGFNEAFILTGEQLEELPESEQKCFRPAIYRDAIMNGVAYPRYFVFFPYDKNGLVFSDEQGARVALPSYFQGHLDPHKDDLVDRSGIGESKPWWALSRYYPWVQRAEGRLLTKYFGTVGDIAMDEAARFVPLHGYAWFLRVPRGKSSSVELRLLRAYHTLLNTRTFARLLKVYSTPVAGGQFNLSARFVRPIPLPDLSSAENAGLAADLSGLLVSTEHPSAAVERGEELASRAWGDRLVEALAEMDDV